MQPPSNGITRQRKKRGSAPLTLNRGMFARPPLGSALRRQAGFSKSLSVIQCQWSSTGACPLRVPRLTRDREQKSRLNLPRSQGGDAPDCRGGDGQFPPPRASFSYLLISCLFFPGSLYRELQLADSPRRSQTSPTASIGKPLRPGGKTMT